MLVAILALSLLLSENEMVATSSTWNPTVVEAYIRQAAEARGIDPNTAVAVARTEGLNNPVGDAGHSFGPYQLYVGGGLGNAFQQLTGLDPANYLNNWPAQVDYFLNWAAQHGWNPGAVGLGSSYVGGTGGGSHGASAAGISNMQGLTNAHTIPIGTDVGGGVTDTGNPNIGLQGTTGTDTGTQATTGVQGTANAGAVPPPTGLNLSFPGSVQHVIFQFLLVIVGIALLLGGIYLLGSHK